MTNEELQKLLYERCEETGWRKLCGIEIASLEDQKLTLSMKVTPEVSNRHGIAHGGAISGMLDTCMGLSCIIAGKNVVTMNLNVNFIRGAKIGTTVYTTAELSHVGLTTIVTDSKCFDAEGTLYAKATGTFYVLRSGRK